MLYDQALLTWFNDNLPTLLPGRNTKIMFMTPRKSFAEVTTGLVPDNLVRTVPRISIQRLALTREPLRYNSNRIRHLGYCKPPLTQQKITGKFPTPINIDYQIDLNTRQIDEMSRWEEFILDQFASSRVYLTIRPNDTWGDKIYPVFLEGALADNSDLEPQEDGERQVRKTINLRAECWIFDKAFESKYVVKRIEMIFVDSNTSQEVDRGFLPPLETVFSCNGIQTSFGPATLYRPPVLEKSIIFQTVIGGSTEIISDDGSGNLIGDNVSSGTINYTTGEVSLTFSTAPDDTESITATYFTDLS